MESTFNFESLFVSAPQINYKEKKIFQKAALLYEFSIPKDFKGFESEDINQLKENANQRSNDKYVLEDTLRNSIILESIGLDNVIIEINKFEIDSEYSQILIQALNSSEVNWIEFHDSSLFYLLKIADLLPSKLDKTEIATELRRRYYFVFFEKMIQNFAGRSNEISKINEYIDWLPKQGALNNLFSIFRHTINWHQKKPMLIHGIGGIGKSTLISKIIIDNNKRKSSKRLPFVYLDFDLPGFTLSEPITILIESLRQLSFQFPKEQGIFNKINSTLSDMIENKYEDQGRSRISSNRSLRGIVYYTINDVIKDYNGSLKNLKSPILIVFDSFEEMQYRATSEELYNFFNFVQEICEQIPRIRPIFVGRSEIQYSVNNISFENVQLSEFDKESSRQMLLGYQVKEAKAAEKIYNIFGGNPLILKLASRIYADDPSSIENFDKQKNTKYEYLVNRILAHVHNDDVRKIAVPGLILRRISPEIISDVLADACKIKIINDAHAKRIFNELEKEAALINKSSSDSSIVFRQDLRMACEDMIHEQFSEESKKIIENAIRYYGERRNDGELYEAEYFYHLLKNNQIPEDLTREKYKALRTRLESAIIEFPNRSLAFVNSLIGSRVNSEVLESTEIFEWENYFISQIKIGLNSDPEFLKQVESENGNRKDRRYGINPEYAYLKALMYQRLNSFNKSNNIIESTISFLRDQQSDNVLYYELLFIQAHNLEYETKFGDSNKLCTQVLNDLEKLGVSDRLEYSGLYRKFHFLSVRTSNRAGFKQTLNAELMHIESNQKNRLFEDVYWEFQLTPKNSSTTFLTAVEWIAKRKLISSKIKNIKQLEELTRRNLGIFIKDIALTGGFDILFTDCFHAFEVAGILDKLDFGGEIK